MIEEQNSARANHWYCYIPGMDEFTFKLKTCPIPEVNLGTIDMPTNSDIKVKLPGDRLDYQPMNMTFIVDENYANHRKLYEWMVSNVVNYGTDLRDIMILLLDSNMKPIDNCQINVSNSFPTTLTEVMLDSEAPNPVLICNCIINYDEWYYEKISVIEGTSILAYE